MTSFEKETTLIKNKKALIDKAISSLKGLLLGINIDGTVNKQEIIELKKWVQVHKNLIHQNPFSEFMNLIKQSTSNLIPLRETIEDLYWLCQKYETDNYYYNAVTADLQTLQGICHGILADGIINDKEIYDLEKWLKENEHLNSFYPYDELRSLILSIISDHKIDEDEKTILKAFFSQFVNLLDEGINKQVKTETNNLTISGLCTSEPSVNFPGKSFCITGVLKRGNREELQNEIRNQGGNITENITLKTDYLIVGDNGNPAWAFSCYGRKVEKAIKLRKEGHTIMLIHEFDFSDILDDLK